ncbi:hypothetical protein AC578_5674 [Pseudocercospora eumusae]|uniref:Uncharacterized protein n=1 Tax=Pseudocercospora eumusae TaxID=321146 RepID=A0A139H3E9_9PEZI|nr:hypothetical protein AC578_5674 [Pseudocercospora eumusae]
MPDSDCTKADALHLPRRDMFELLKRHSIALGSQKYYLSTAALLLCAQDHSFLQGVILRFDNNVDGGYIEMVNKGAGGEEWMNDICEYSVKSQTYDDRKARSWLQYYYDIPTELDWDGEVKETPKAYPISKEISETLGQDPSLRPTEQQLMDMKHNLTEEECSTPAKMRLALIKASDIGQPELVINTNPAP